MNRLPVLIVILLLAGAALCAQNITVTAPAAGVTLDIGGTYMIRWTHRGAMIDTVKVILVAVPGGPDPITDSTANDNEFEWRIPDTVTPGTYFIRVKTTDNLVWGESDRFTIRDAPAPPPTSTLRITHPSASENFCLNKANEITWDPGNTAGQRVGIQLRQGGRSPVPIVASTENDGRFTWTPAAGTPGGPGIIEIVSASERALLGASGSFNLTTCVTFTAPLQAFTPCIRVTSPAVSPLTVGQYYAVNWETSSSDCGSLVQLTAVRLADSAEITIRGGLSNEAGRHHYTWFIDPPRFRDHPGQYRVRARSTSGAVADSREFEVNTSGAITVRDLILSLDPSSMEVTHILGGGDLTHHLFRMHITLRMMNATREISGAPLPDIREVLCYWTLQLKRHEGDPSWQGGLHYTQNPGNVFMAGPVRSGEWTEQRITIEFKIPKPSHDRAELWCIGFELDPANEISDPNHANNYSNSPAFYQTSE